MKTRLLLTTLIAFGFHAVNGFAAKEPSKISAFDGKYSGTLFLTSSGSSFAGPSTARFNTSPTKEKGSLVLTSTITSGSTTFIFTEQLKFNKKSLVYTFTQSGGGTSATGIGSGRANIRKKTIKFQTAFNISGTTFTVVGTIKRSKKGLTALNTLSTGGSSAFFSYSLKER